MDFLEHMAQISPLDSRNKMGITIYIIRFLLALLFFYAGIEKLFLPYDPSIFKANAADSNPLFFEYYDLLYEAGYLYFVGFFQLLCGLLMLFKRTYLLASIMLVPLILCLLMTHVYFSKNSFYIGFDATLFVLNVILIFNRFQDLAPTILKPQNSFI